MSFFIKHGLSINHSLSEARVESGVIIFHMSEEDFRAFLEKHWGYPDEIENIILEASGAQCLLRKQAAGVFLTPGQADELAWELRKRFAISISLRDTGIASAEEQIADLDSEIQKYENQ